MASNHILPDPYASHLTFLRRLGPGAVRVLELGCGRYSTPLFLDHDAYPNLIELVTVEHDRHWLMQIDDPRWKLVLCAEPFEEFLGTLDLSTFNIIFVDHSTDWQRRSNTIRWLATQQLGQARVVIHDFEEACYQEAAEGFRFKIVDTTITPHTAMVWGNK